MRNKSHCGRSVLLAWSKGQDWILHTYKTLLSSTQRQDRSPTGKAHRAWSWSHPASACGWRNRRYKVKVKRMVPLTLEVDIRWMRIASFMFRPFYSTVNHELFVPRLSTSLCEPIKAIFHVTNSAVYTAASYSLLSNWCDATSCAFVWTGLVFFSGLLRATCDIARIKYRTATWMPHPSKPPLLTTYCCV
jgi:hypothetical protein